MTSPASRSSLSVALGALTVAFVSVGCELDREGGGYFLGSPDSPAGAGQNGVASGGTETGGTGTGGQGLGGTGTGGTPAGGTGTGGTDEGGADVGGAETGGADVGGVETGGSESGGAGTGGADTGGVATGGGEAGGVDAGGAGIGGAETGGAGGASGSAGVPGGGATAGGADTGGSSAGGAAADGGAGASGGGVAGAAPTGGASAGGAAGSAGAGGVAASAGAGGVAGAAGAGAAAGGVTPGGAGGAGGTGQDTNLIANPGFEDGLEGWEIYGAGPLSPVTITATSDAAHSGEQCLLVVGRDANEQGPAYSLTGLVSEDDSYRLVVWARLPDGADPDPISRFAASVRVTCGATSSTVRVLRDQTVSSDAWSEHVGTFSVQCAIGTPSAVVLYFHAPDRVDGFYIDDVVVEPEV